MELPSWKARSSARSSALRSAAIDDARGGRRPTSPPRNRRDSERRAAPHAVERGMRGVRRARRLVDERATDGLTRDAVEVEVAADRREPVATTANHASPRRVRIHIVKKKHLELSTVRPSDQEPRRRRRVPLGPPHANRGGERPPRSDGVLNALPKRLLLLDRLVEPLVWAAVHIALPLEDQRELSRGRAGRLTPRKSDCEHHARHDRGSSHGDLHGIASGNPRITVASRPAIAPVALSRATGVATGPRALYKRRPR
jgi:hypothetical protein